MLLKPDATIPVRKADRGQTKDLLKKAERAKDLEAQLAEYERTLRMNLTHKSVSQESNLVPFPAPMEAEPQAASAQGDD